MELSPRKNAVLEAVIKAYIETGEPVGSKALTGMLSNAPSSATLRNELSSLCELGLLFQPHTSAGRVPTSHGLRLYINSLMSPVSISKTAKDFIDAGLKNMHCDTEKIPDIAGELISNLTGLPAFTCFMGAANPKIKRVELLPISRSTAMLLIISSDGRTRNRIFRLGTDLANISNRFLSIVKEKINGKNISELTKAYMQSVMASSGIDSLSLTPLFTAIFEMAEGLESAGVNLYGEPSLYNICQNEETVRRIKSLIDRGEPILSIIEGIDGGAGVIFGNDTIYNELNPEIIVAAKFNGADKYKGAIGVIGPTRISYDLIIPCVEYIAQKLTEIINQAQKDMED